MSEQKVMEENKVLCQEIVTLKATAQDLRQKATATFQGFYNASKYADQENQYINKLLEDACKLKRKHAALKANKSIANESVKAKTAAYNKFMDKHKRLKKEKVQVKSKLEEYVIRREMQRVPGRSRFELI